MEFTGNEGSPISSENAKKWRIRYEENEKALNPEKIAVKGHFFGKEKLQQLLDIENSVGIRIYYGLNDKNEKELLLYAVRSDMSDIEPGPEEDGGEVIILDESQICPPYCS